MGRFTRIPSWRSRLGQSWTHSACAETHGNGPPDPRMACAEIGPVRLHAYDCAIFDEAVRQPERWNATGRTLRETVVDWPSSGPTR